MKIGIHNRIGYIQTAYFIDSLVELFENEHLFCFNTKESKNLEYLEKVFNYNTQVGLSDIDILLNLNIDHIKPAETILGHEFSLVFPHRLISKIRAKWPKQRKYDYAFVGLMTEKRKWVFEYKDMDNTLIVDSNKGRIFPEKLFDENYWEILLNTKFSLCPQGDYMWTYRVFESIIAGSIPIVENSYPLISRFGVYERNSEQSVKWSDTLVEDNLNILVENFTFSDMDRKKLNVAFDAARPKKKASLNIQKLKLALNLRRNCFFSY